MLSTDSCFNVRGRLLEIVVLKLKDIHLHGCARHEASHRCVARLFQTNQGQDGYHEQQGSATSAAEYSHRLNCQQIRP